MLAMAHMKTGKYFLRTALVGLVVLIALWLFGAWEAGLFIRDKSVPASSPEKSTEESLGVAKKYIEVGPWNVAYFDVGKGEPLVLLHGCPFQSLEYFRIIPQLSLHHRVIVPDLLGLGDTVVRLDDDYRLPNQEKMVVGLMDQLGIKRAAFVGHDHGGAIVELLMRDHPERISASVLTNVEAYDLWPSKPEQLDVKLVANPITSPLMRLLLGSHAVQRWIYRIAVKQSSTLTDELLGDFTRPNMATPARWLRLRRFVKFQLDHDNNLETQRAVEGMRQFHQPTLILWGEYDTNFGTSIAERLNRDIPGAKGIKWMKNSAHLPMLEEPESYANAIEEFLEKYEKKKN